MGEGRTSQGLLVILAISLDARTPWFIIFSSPWCQVKPLEVAVEGFAVNAKKLGGNGWSLPSGPLSFETHSVPNLKE